MSIVSGPGRTLFAQQEEPGSPRATAPLTILQLNDVYSIAADRRRGRARARRDIEAADDCRRPDAVHDAGGRFPVVVGGVDRLQGRADDCHAQCRRPRHGDARQPRVRLRHRCAAAANGRSQMAVGDLERDRHRDRQADRRRGSLRRAHVWFAEGRFHRLVPDGRHRHTGQAGPDPADRPAGGGRDVSARAEERGGRCHRRAHASHVRRGSRGWRNAFRKST